MKDEIEEIKSLMVNYGLNWRNPRPKTKMKRVPNFGAKIEIFQGLNCMKFKIWSQLGVYMR